MIGFQIEIRNPVRVVDFMDTPCWELAKAAGPYLRRDLVFPFLGIVSVSPILAFSYAMRTVFSTFHWEMILWFPHLPIPSPCTAPFRHRSKQDAQQTSAKALKGGLGIAGFHQTWLEAMDHKHRIISWLDLHSVGGCSSHGADYYKVASLSQIFSADWSRIQDGQHLPSTTAMACFEDRMNNQLF